MVFLALSGKMVFLFPENMTFFLRRKTKEGLFQKICSNMMSSVYSMKTVFLFPTNAKLPFFQKKMIFSRKNTPKDDISGITTKDDIHPRKYGISIEIPY